MIYDAYRSLILSVSPLHAGSLIEFNDRSVVVDNDKPVIKVELSVSLLHAGSLIGFNDRSVVVDNDKPVIKVERDVAILDLSAVVVEAIDVQSETRLGMSFGNRFT